MDENIALTATILGTITNDGVTFYNIEITMEGNIVWKIKRWYSQFDTLMISLRKWFKELPWLPDKSYLFGLSEVELEDRG